MHLATLAFTCFGKTKRLALLQLTKVGRRLIIVINIVVKQTKLNYEPRHGKTGLRGFRPGLTQTDLYSHRQRLEA